MAGFVPLQIFGSIGRFWWEEFTAIVFKYSLCIGKNMEKIESTLVICVIIFVIEVKFYRI